MKIVIPTSDGVDVEVHRTLDAERVGAGEGAPAIIVCHGFVQNRLAFECQKRSLLAHLRSLGLVVYVVELRGRAGKDTAAGFVDYVDRDAAAVLGYVKARHPSVAWLGHSMGGLIGTLLEDVARDSVDAVVTIGAPLFAGRPELNRFFPPARSVSAARFAHARGFRFEGRRWSGLLYAMRGVLNQPRVPAPLRIWAPGSLDEATLAFTLKQSFADDSWAVFADLLELVVTDADRAGPMYTGARLKQFDKPLLVIAGDADDLAPPAGARPLFERVSTSPGDKEYLELPAGHIDLLLGDNAPARVWAPISRFLRRHLPLER